jgi:hypothetical protein
VEELVVGGFASEGDGIALGFGAEAPAIQHCEYERFRSFCHSDPVIPQNFGEFLSLDTRARPGFQTMRRIETDYVDDMVFANDFVV